MKRFNSQLRYVEARPRKDKKGAKATTSVVVAGAASSEDGVSKSYVDSNFVTLSTEQTIPGPKNFAGGIKVNGQPLIYNAELGVWVLTGDLLVTGNVAWFASIKGFKPSTIMDAVQVDGETIVINELGQLKAIGGGSGGSGGGLTVSDLSNYLTTNKYTKQSDVETLISTALTPYALTAAIPTNNTQLSNGAGYITAAALDGYATQSWVEGKKYLTGITSSQVTTALGYTPYNSSNPDKYIKGIDYDMVIAALGYTPYSTTNPMGYLTISSLLGYATEQWVGDNYLSKSGGILNGRINFRGGVTIDYESSALSIKTSAGASYIGMMNEGFCHIYTDAPAFYMNKPLFVDNGKTVIHSGNIDQQSVLSATKLSTPRTIWGQSFDGTGNVYGSFYTTDNIFLNSGGEGIYISANSINWHNSSNGWSNGLLGFIADGTVVAHNKLAIGGTTADAKLHVYGDTIVDGSLETSKIYIEDTSTPLTRFVIAGSLRATVGYETNFGAILQSYVGGHYFLLKDDTTAYISCNTTINGDLLTTGAITATKIYAASSTATSLIEIKVNGSTSVATFGYENGYGTIIQSYKGGNYFLLKDDNTAFLSCSTTINGNLLVNGNVSWITQSQRSLKHITSEQGLSLAQLERIKPIKFYWKDRRDTELHVGGIADDMQEILPEVVQRGWDNTLRMNYVDASFYIGASLIAPVLDHDRRIAQLERENAELKQKLNQLAS